MAYVLGFFTADGNMIKNKRGAHFISFYNTDKKILKNIKEIMGVAHKLSLRPRRSKKHKDSYRLQIGSKEIFNDLLRLGLTPAKSKTLDLPIVPDKYFPDFLRGYFDGDGCISSGIYRRKDRNSTKFLLASHFTSGSKVLLDSLLNKLRKTLATKTGFIYAKNRGFDLTLSINDSKKLFDLMYENLKNNLFLERKFNKFRKAIKLSNNMRA